MDEEVSRGRDNRTSSPLSVQPRLLLKDRRPPDLVKRLESHPRRRQNQPQPLPWPSSVRSAKWQPPQSRPPIFAPSSQTPPSAVKPLRRSTEPPTGFQCQSEGARHLPAPHNPRAPAHPRSAPRVPARPATVPRTDALRPPPEPPAAPAAGPAETQHERAARPPACRTTPPSHPVPSRLQPPAQPAGFLTPRRGSPAPKPKQTFAACATQVCLEVIDDASSFGGARETPRRMMLRRTSGHAATKHTGPAKLCRPPLPVPCFPQRPGGSA